MPSLDNSILLFTTLFALYSPLASVSSYFPLMSRLTLSDRRRLAFRIFINVTIFALAALWIGEPLLAILGITTAALTVTGGIALLYVGIPLMRGVGESPPAEGEEDADDSPESWRSVLFMPATFPLTVGGTTFAILVSFRSMAADRIEALALSAAAIAYAAVTGITVYVSGRLERWVSPPTRDLLQRIAGILLTAIAVSLLANGGPRMVVETLAGLKH